MSPRPLALFSRLTASALNAALVVSLLTGFAHAETAPTQAAEKSFQHLSEGKIDATINYLESLADEGVRHPDVSYNRGVAYLRRSELETKGHTDLGQAAAGFAEACQMRPHDPGARKALREVQELIAREARDKDTSSENLTLGLAEQALLWLVPLYLALVGLSGSLLTCVGVVLRKSTRENRRVSGNILALIGVVLLSVASGCALLRETLFSESRVAVVVSGSAPIFDETSTMKKDFSALRQGTVVYLSTQSAGLSRVVSLSGARWLRSSDLRIVSEGAEASTRRTGL